MMNRPRKRLVLYSPHHLDTKVGLRVTKHYLPLALLSIAGLPDRDGYEVVLIDGNLYPEEEGHRRVLDACEGALLYATTGILGYQVADALQCTRKVKERHPDLPAFIGGWFASTLPELSLSTGLYDAVCFGQGEHTFREIVAAVESGAALDGVAGLALWRDGEVVFTPHRPMVGWDRLPNYPWHLIDFESYAEQQRDEFVRRVNGALPPPPGFEPGRSFRAAAYCSSYGCPLACTFCCSAGVCARHWEAMPAERMLDDLCGLQERWGFDVVAFYDANWGVDGERAHAFARGLLERGKRLRYYPFLQAESVLSWSEERLADLARSGLYATVLGAEAGSDETLRAIGKPERGDGNLEAVGRLHRAGISARVTYIIGFPDEDEASMLATIDQCRRMAVLYPSAAPTVWPYVPIPGAQSYARAVELGFRPPSTHEEWGRFLHFKLGGWWPDAVPPRVMRVRNLYEHFVSLLNGTARGKVGFWERRAMRRLSDERDFARGWPLGRLEARSFALWDRLERRLPRWTGARERTVGRGWKVASGSMPPVPRA
jgi:radical SAM superfamily enzyme YgiQ (UPF0313 family)